jgi:hypothetical protein
MKELNYNRFGNRYFENLNEVEEVPGEFIPSPSPYGRSQRAMAIQVVTDG